MEDEARARSRSVVTCHALTRMRTRPAGIQRSINLPIDASGLPSQFALALTSGHTARIALGAIQRRAGNVQGPFA